MNNQIQLVLKSSTTELSLNNHELGIYLVPELDGFTGLPEIRTTSGVNAGYDGGWTSAQNYDARSITIRGVIANENVATVEQLRRQLTTLAGQGKNEELTLDLVTQAGKAYTVQARTIALEMSLQKVLTQQEFMLQLRADDPLIYDGGTSGESVIVQVQKAIGGFQIDFELPLAISGGSGESTINNGGLEQVYPIIKMYGALHNPTFVNQTTNQQFQVNATLGFADGAWHTPSELYEGTTINIPDAPDNAPLASFHLGGNTSQQTYSGKNLFDYTNPVASASGLTTVLNSDGTLTTTGVPSRNYVTIVSSQDITSLLEDGATYTVQHSDSGNYLNLQVTAPKVGGGNDYYIGKSFTVDKTTHSSYNISVVSTTTANWGTSSRTIKAWYQLEKGSAATSFEPYVGGVPAPNPDYPQAVRTVTGENVVKICGKNLFNKSTNYNNSTIDAANGNIGSNSNFLTIWAECQPNTTYTISKGAPTTRFVVADSTKIPQSGDHCNVLDGYNSQSTSKTITTSSSAKYLIAMVKSGQDTLSQQAILDFMQIELGSTATAYEPYQGQSYEVNLGKNLFDKNNANLVDGQITSSKTLDTSAGKTLYIPCEPNTTYTVQKKTSSRSRLGTSQEIMTTSNSLTNYTQTITDLGGGLWKLTITSGPNDKYLYLTYAIASDDFLTIRASIQIEKGSQATSYAPYFTPIKLCGLGDDGAGGYLYKDGIYKNLTDNKWYVRKEIVKYTFNGSENWTSRQGNNVGLYQITLSEAILLPASTSAMPQVLSSHFKAATNDSTWSSNGNPCFSAVNGSNPCILRFSKGEATNDLAAWKTWLGSNNVSVYAILATPTDTEITNETLIAQLEALLNTARTYAGVNNIFTITPNEQGTLEISYMTEKDADKRDVMVIDSRMRTVTLNGADIYHLITSGSEFPMLAPGENKLLLRSDTPGDNGYADVNYKQGYLTI